MRRGVGLLRDTDGAAPTTVAGLEELVGLDSVDDGAVANAWAALREQGWEARIYGHPAEAPAGTLPVRAQRSYAAAAVLFAFSNFAVGVAASPLIDILEHGLAMF